jgi:hypothetical protein
MASHENTNYQYACNYLKNTIRQCINSPATIFENQLVWREIRHANIATLIPLHELHEY